MMELKDKHTGIYIKNMVEKVLLKYEIRIHQIYSITTNNGANMISFVKLFRAEIESEYSVIEPENEFEDQFMYEFYFENNFPFHDLVGIRCAAHTLQLAIKDSIEIADVYECILSARELVRKLRIPSLTVRLQSSHIKRPVIDCPTRWNSTFNMLKSLLACKVFTYSLAENNLDYYLAESKWDIINSLVDILAPLNEATMKLQSEQLTLSDFYGIWMQCKLRIQNSENFFGEIFFRQLSYRETSLLKSDGLLGAVYLDPRYQILLSSAEKVRAVQHLKKIWNKLEFLDKSIPETNNKENFFYETSEGNYDDFESFLRSKESSNSKNRISDRADVDIEFILNSFNNVQRLDRKIPILEFWEENKAAYPHLYKNSAVVLGAPATQVSVERAFSGLKFILRDNRNSLKENTLEDILIIRANFAQFN